LKSIKEGEATSSKLDRAIATAIGTDPLKMNLPKMQPKRTFRRKEGRMELFETISGKSVGGLIIGPDSRFSLVSDFLSCKKSIPQPSPIDVVWISISNHKTRY
jgi:hypothetical protein